MSYDSLFANVQALIKGEGTPGDEISFVAGHAGADNPYLINSAAYAAFGDNGFKVDTANTDNVLVSFDNAPFENEWTMETWFSGESLAALSSTTRFMRLEPFAIDLKINTFDPGQHKLNINYNDAATGFNVDAYANSDAQPMWIVIQRTIGSLGARLAVYLNGTKVLDVANAGTNAPSITGIKFFDTDNNGWCWDELRFSDAARYVDGSGDPLSSITVQAESWPEEAPPNLGEATLIGPALTALGYSGASAQLVAPAPSITARAVRNVLNTARLVGSKPSLSGYSGANANLTGSMLALTAAATNVAVGRAQLVAPAPEITGVGVRPDTGYAVLRAGAPLLAAYGGASAQLTGPKMSMQGRARLEAAGRAVLVAPAFELTASATQEAFGSARLVAPALIIPGVGGGALGLPAMRLQGIGTMLEALVFEAYATNLNPMPDRQGEVVNEVTHFTAYPFTQIVRFGDHYYGLGPDGVYLLEGDTDDGDPIEYAWLTVPHDWGTPNKKTAESLYVLGRLGPNAVVHVQVGEASTESHTYSNVRGEGLQNHRQKLGRGVRSRHVAFGLFDTTGGECQVSALEPLINTLDRTI